MLAAIPTQRPDLAVQEPRRPVEHPVVHDHGCGVDAQVLLRLRCEGAVVVHLPVGIVLVKQRRRLVPVNVYTLQYICTQNRCTQQQDTYEVGQCSVCREGAEGSLPWLCTPYNTGETNT